MELALKVDEVVGDESDDLLRWLHKERNLRGLAEVFTGGTEPPPPGSMGGIPLEVINVVLSNSIALGSLLTTLVAWRSSRPSPPPTVRIEVNGALVTLNTDDPEVIRSLIETLRNTSSGPASDDPNPALSSGS
ncbi:hypothetical protein OG696_40665 [Streptomyces sp. NBC_00656]|uniref:effector-associated constant component EACC1 n=1 Tax=Streptomyces sp. NBC_00656 TaxID=2903668 RepID=UPI0032562771